MQPAVLAPTTKLRLVSPGAYHSSTSRDICIAQARLKGFPWVIDIDTEHPTEDDRFPAGAVITVEILLRRLYASLRNRMTASEWLLCDKTKR